MYETSELGDCEKCGAQRMPGFNYCPQCGTQFKKECEVCKSMVDLNWKFCPFCDNQLRERKIVSQDVINPVAMEQSIVELRETASEAVSGNKTKYKERKGISLSLGKAVISVIMRWGGAINSALIAVVPKKKSKSNDLKVEAEQDGVEQDEESSKKNRLKSLLKKKKRKKKKRDQR